MPFDEQMTARRASFLDEVSRHLAESLDYQATLERIARLAVPELADWCAVHVLEGGVVRPVALVHADEAKEAVAWGLERHYPRKPDHPILRALESGQPQLVADIPEQLLAAIAHDDAHLDALRALGLTSYVVAPLVARGRTLGALTLATAESGRHYGADDLALAVDVAQRAAFALDNARLYREAETAAHELRRLRHVTDSALAHLTLDDLLRELLARICEVLTCDTGAVLLLSSDGTTLTLRAEQGLAAEPLALSIPLGESVSGRIAATGEALVVEDLAAADVAAPFLLEHGVRSVLGVPLLLQGHVIGVLHVGSRAVRQFPGEDVRLLQLVADRVALAIDRARLYDADRHAREHAETAERRASFLAEAARVLATSPDYEQTLAAVARLAVPLLGDVCAFDVLEPDGMRRRVASADARGDRHETLEDVTRVAPGESAAPHPVAKVIEMGRAVIIDATAQNSAAATPEYLAMLRARGIASLLVVPLVGHIGVVGVLICASTMWSRRYDDGELRVAEQLALRVAMAIENSHLYRRAELAHDDAERRLAELGAVYASAPIGLCFIDPELRVVRINQRMAEMSGLSAAAHLGRPLRHVLPHLAATLEPIYDRVIEAGEAVVGLEVKAATRGAAAPDRYWLTSFRAVRGPGGQVLGVNTAVEDITDRKRAEAERRELLSETEQARAEAERAADLLQRLQSVTDVTLSDAPLPRLLDELLARTRSALNSDTATVLLVDEDDPGHLVPVASQGLEAEIDGGVRVRVGDGIAGRIAASRQPVVIHDVRQADVVSPYLRGALTSLVGAPLVLDGRVLGVLHVGTATRRRFTHEDVRLLQLVSDRAASAIGRARLQAAERQAHATAEHANRAKDQFLAVVSHELRSPLAAVLGWVHVLERDPRPEVVRRGVDAVRRNARMQSRLIEDLLDVSRIVTGKLVLQRTRVDPRSIVEAAVEMVSHMADAKRVRLRSAATPVPRLLGDPTRLQQVVTNLLTNAIKFTPAGGEVDARLDPDGARVRLVVRDTGEGIAPDLLPHVFDRFSQGQAAPGRPEGGLGLGLAIVRSLVELHGGTVRAESQGPGTGASFTVWLPVAPEEDPREEPRDAPVAAAPLPSLGGSRVLVVDADPDTGDLHSLLLAEAGAETRTTASLHQALEIVASWPPDVILVDLGASEQDGGEFLRAVAARLGTRPVVAAAITSPASADDRDRVAAAGFRAHLVRPVDRHDLVRAVAALSRFAGPS